MYYFEKAMICLKQKNRPEYILNILEGINNNEVYSYYLAYLVPLDIDMKEFEELVLKNDDMSYAVQGKQMIMKGRTAEGIELLKKSNTGIAKYNLYIYYIENDDIHNAKQYLNEALDYDFPLAYYEYVNDLRFNGDLTRFELNGEKFINACKKGIEFGFVEAYYALAKLYTEGYYLEKDITKAIKLYEALPDSEYSYRNIHLIKSYYEIKDYDKVYDLCVDYINSNEFNKSTAIHYLSLIYENKNYKNYDLIKSLILKKSLLNPHNSERHLIEIANIYYKELNDNNMAIKYVKLFNKLVENNDTCISLFEDYEEMIYELENLDFIEPKKISISKVHNKENYELIVKGFLSDQKDCFKELASYYDEGIIVEKDIVISRILYDFSKISNICFKGLIH